MSDLSRAKSNWLFFGILLLALALRVLFFSGYQGSDDAALAFNAIRILNEGFFVPESHYSARIGLTVPLSWVFTVFGISENAIAGFALMFSLLGIWLAYVIGRETAGPGVGLIAALLLTIFPLDVYYATSLYPDVPLGVALALSFYCTLRALKAERPLWWVLAAGLAWGYGYLAKIEAVFMGAVFLVMMWQHRGGGWLRVLSVILLFGAVVAGESIAYWLVTGDTVHRIKVIQGIGMKASAEYGAGQLWVYPKAWFVTFYEFGLFYYLLFTALIWAAWKRKGKLLLVSVWLIIYLIWLEFGGNPFSASYSVKSHLLRYLGMISVPMAIICSYFILHAFKSTTMKVVAVTFMVLTSMFFVNFNSLGQERFYAAKQGVNYAMEHNLFPLYADHTSGAIGIFQVKETEFEGQVSRIQEHSFKDGETEILPLERMSGYLLLVRDSMDYTSKRYYMKALDIDKLGETYETVYRLDNPMNALAYKQAELLVAIGNMIPVQFLRDKIAGTGNRLLKDKDVVIFKLTGEPDGE